MDQRKIGSFLRELRSEKRITQEQLAEEMLVSNRTVSRWETGANLPDLLLLVQLADYYQVEIGEILNGERKDGAMDRELEDTIIKVADYSNGEKERMMKRLHWLSLAGVASFALFLVLDAAGLAHTGYTEIVASFALGFSFGMLLLGVLCTSRYMAKLRAWKKKLLART